MSSFLVITVPMFTVIPQQKKQNVFAFTAGAPTQLRTTKFLFGGRVKRSICLDFIVPDLLQAKRRTTAT